MVELHVDRIKKVLAILFVAFFVVSATAAAVSAARLPSGYGYNTNVVAPVDVNINNAITTQIANAIEVNTIVSNFNTGNIILNANTYASTQSKIDQRIRR